MLSDLLPFLLNLELWQQILTILSIGVILFGIIRFISSLVTRKLLIEIQEKEWRNYTPQTESEYELDIRLSTILLFHNKLGKDTTLNEIRIEREKHDPIIISHGTTIPNNQSYSMHHIWELGQETSIKGKLVVKHTHNESFIPLDEKIPVPIVELPKHGIQVFTAKRPY